MTTSLPGDRARAVVTVNVGLIEAFRIFTEEIDGWWRRGPRYRNAPWNGNTHSDNGIVCVEPREGGRLFESFKNDGIERIVQMGEVTCWQPPDRVEFRWRASNFAANEFTQVAVEFFALESDSDGRARTRVEVTHSGWTNIRADHPVRHALPVGEFVAMIGMWWGDQLTSYRFRCRG
jgi:uncharacterized protein YndB with AHSA1/START domain